MNFLKSHVSVWETLATQLTIDNKTIRSLHKRATSEQFFYRDLPLLGKAFDRALTSGRLSLDDVPFKRASKTDVRPAFMHEFFKQVFDREGYILLQPEKIVEIRQLTMMFYKFKAPLVRDSLRLATLKFMVTDCQVKTSNWPDTLPEVRKNFQGLCPGMPNDIRPHHSNGATFDKSDNYERRIKRKFFPLLYSIFGLSMFFPSSISAMNALEGETPCIQKSRVSFVPKDSRGPRTICIEAHEPMMAQKGLQQLLYDHIEYDSPAKGYINFTDQSINRRLAQLGSIDGSYATIDLKDASDLVSNSLVNELATSEWRAALKATRSSVVELNGFDFNLKKFAPMGSALCFPIEAMIFWSIAKTVTDTVYVYGDDIIVSGESAEAVISALESYGLKVNHGKTLTKGFFRESCGGDFFRGQPINYTKISSYDQSSYIPFLNLISIQYGTTVADALAVDYEARMDIVMHREELQHRDRPSQLTYYCELTASSDVFFSRRWNFDHQNYERLLLNVTTRSKRRKSPVGSRDEEFLYFDWLARFHPSNQPDDYNINREYVELPLEREIRGVPIDTKASLKAFRDNLFRDVDNVARVAIRQVEYPVTKYSWVPEKG